MQLAWKKAIVTLGFVAAIAAVVVLNAGAAGARSAGVETIRLREAARATGIDFVHHAATLDPKLDRIAAHVAALGACVSVSDVDNDGWPDLYFTSSRLGRKNAVFLNQHG